MNGASGEGAGLRMQMVDGGRVAVLGVGYGPVGQEAVEGVDSLGDARILTYGDIGAEFGEFHHVGEGRVGEGEGAGVGNGGGHIGDAVMDHAVDDVAGVGVGGGPCGLDAAALVD